MSSLAFIPLILFSSVAFICLVVRVIVELRERPLARARATRPVLVVIEGGKPNAAPVPWEPAPESRIA
jgi:hypothetical protein